MRHSFLAILCVLASAASSQAQVSIWHSPGYTFSQDGHQFNTWTAMAMSDYPIVGIDFGSGEDNPMTGFGYFGPLNQVTVAGQPTPYQDLNALMPEPRQDSQFLVRTTDVMVLPGVSKESESTLQGAWTWSEPQGTKVSFAQLAIRFARQVRYRGTVTVLIDNTPIPFTVTGFHGYDPPEPATWMLVAIGGLSLSGLRRSRCTWPM